MIEAVLEFLYVKSQQSYDCYCKAAPSRSIIISFRLKFPGAELKILATENKLRIYVQ